MANQRTLSRAESLRIARLLEQNFEQWQGKNQLQLEALIEAEGIERINRGHIGSACRNLSEAGGPTYPFRGTGGNALGKIADIETRIDNLEQRLKTMEECMLRSTLEGESPDWTAP